MDGIKLAKKVIAQNSGQKMNIRPRTSSNYFNYKRQVPKTPKTKKAVNKENNPNAKLSQAQNESK